MTSTPGMQAMIALEDEAPDVLFETVASTGDALWPLLRWPLSRSVAEVDINTVLLRGTRTRTNAITDALRGRLPNRRDALRIPPGTEHLFIVHGGTRVPNASGYTNWLVDDFAKALGPDAAVLQDLLFDRWAPRTAVPALAATYTFAPALSRVEYRTKVSPLPEEERRRLSLIVDEIFRLLPFEVPAPLHGRARSQALRRAARVPHVNEEFLKVIDTVRPRRIFMQTAAYGDRSNVIRLAHDAGIRVAELQHGWIGESHAAYNYGKAASHPLIAAALPDSLLTFGEFWGRSIRFPGEIVPIGKPQITANAPRPFEDRPKNLLLVSSKFEPEELMRIAHQLRQTLPVDWTIRLRPHPSERGLAVQRYASVLELPDVSLDVEPDVNAALRDARAVVGFASTVLFEALAYESHIAVIDSALADHYANAEVFPTRVQDADSIRRFADRVRSAPSPADRELREQVWRKDPLSHFVEEAAR